MRVIVERFDEVKQSYDDVFSAKREDDWLILKFRGGEKEIWVPRENVLIVEIQQ